ncbi:MAG TPA: SET domain-containing protein [Longimicrobiales bacterium]|nr:SET domain-containing protein [Longimicrobiales bacterium]
MLLVKTCKKNSGIHGVGLFADQFIAHGTPTWRFTPGIDQALHPSELQRIPEAARGQFLTYAYLDIRTGLYVLCADDARFMNHSPEPDITSDYNEDPVFGVDIAARDIQAGEELTCDYCTFDRMDRENLTFVPNNH